MKESSASWLSCTCAKGITSTAIRAMSGLMMLTAVHMFRSVLGNTPGCCSSTKLAELSKPEMPSMAVLNPRKSTTGSPARSGAWKLAMATLVPSEKSSSPAASSSTAMEVRCSRKMPMATVADSVMPAMVSARKMESTPTVAHTTGSWCTSPCR